MRRYECRLVLVVPIAAIMLLTAGCQRAQEVQSPSGMHALRTEAAGPDSVRLVVETNGKPSWEAEPVFSSRHRLFPAWGPDDSLWVYSTDVGLFCWTVAGDATWQRGDCKAHAAFMPETIRTKVGSLVDSPPLVNSEDILDRTRRDVMEMMRLDQERKQRDATAKP